jgi:beta-lactamase superfamily II metal-dependent hydrolase
MKHVFLVALVTAFAGCSAGTVGGEPPNTDPPGDESPSLPGAEPPDGTQPPGDSNQPPGTRRVPGTARCESGAAAADLAAFPLRIVSISVSHGDATLLVLPSGELALIDTGQWFAIEDYVLPFFEQHQIDKLDYLIVTHYHGDHSTGKIDTANGVFLGVPDRPVIPVRTFWDYNSFRRGDVLDFGGTTLTILNSANESPNEGENEKSLSLRLEYNGFVYSLGGDIYADQQNEILATLGEETVRSHVYRTNHHLHGSVSKEYLEATDAVLFVTSAEQAVYERDAYTVDFKQVTERLAQPQKAARFLESTLTHEDGNVALGASGADSWDYSCFAVGTAIPGLRTALPQ